MMSPFYYALDYVFRGYLSVIPIRPAALCDDPAKGKQPAIPSWKEYQGRRPTNEELRSPQWFGEESPNGIAIVCGMVSGGYHSYLEVLDFEDQHTFEKWWLQLQFKRMNVLRYLTRVRTPRGYHIYYRVPGKPMKGEPWKLARSKDGRTLIEIKGEGSYVLAPGSPKECHPSGKTYRKVGGPSLKYIRTITLPDRAFLLDLARSFDAPRPAPPPTPPGPVGPRDGQQTKSALGPYSRALLCLQRNEPAVSTKLTSRGLTASQHCFEIACMLVHGFHLSDEQALAAFKESGWNARCLNGQTGELYPWSDAELMHKIRDARERGSHKDMINGQGQS